MEVRHRFGVDVAAEDLNLDCLASLATLAAFITGHQPGPAPARGSAGRWSAWAWG